ncbi:thiolase family protein [Pelagicoccus mobilis]|uniref:Acetyl-CoA C-acyltransferase n=1 Tax=Pelagicoccus mobilis TaxID=415221 RepID=A0A934S1T8_9BACT|nr:acetyl-CoA C-acyltransferase [Pelagicoccus mobilis]MBK1877533.1 acetyl-CoA C-acyltransferase [Pelagicoccus mobilis]
MLRDVLIAGSARTPVGSFGSAFANVSAVDLGKVAVKASLDRAGVPASEVEDVLIGNILSGSLKPNAARQIAVGAGVPVSANATTVNNLCGSGMKTIMMAAQAVQSGDCGVVVAGGAENMSRAPYLLEHARDGYRLGNGEVYDSMLRDALIDAFDGSHMGLCGDKAAEKRGFSREEQDDYAISSYKRALAATEAGEFASEIAPVEIADRKGRITVVDTDEEPQRFNEGKFRALRPAFSKEGTVTAGNASSINDGAAAVVILSPEKAEELNAKVEAKIVGYAQHADDPEWFTLAPIGALKKLLEKIDWDVGEVDLFEINEAFSVVPMAAIQELGIPREKVNVHGGAVCIGHPIGASGTRIVVTLIHALQEAGKKKGIASLCIGGGQAVAMAIELV